MKELEISIFVDSNHGHDKMTGKLIPGIILFMGKTPIYCESKRQSLVQTSTFGTEFISLKKAIEEAVTTRYYLRSMRMKVSKPSIIYANNLSTIKSPPTQVALWRRNTMHYHITSVESILAPE